MIEILTAILVVITGFYAWVTFRILKANEGVLHEMQMQQEALHRPYISISPTLYADNILFFLKVRNTGKTAAHKMRLTIDKDFYKLGEQKEENNLRNYNVFSSVIDSFVPDAEMLFYLAQGFVIFGKNSKESLTPSIFTVTAEYEYGEKKVKENTTIDLRPYLDSAVPHDSIVSKLKDIRDSINNIKNSIDKK